jgi:nucleoid DNA-binding protein
VELAPYIRELILSHECIILPDFGGFETTYNPARFNAELGQMLPPSKTIEFRPDYKIGGEVLEGHLCLKLNIDTTTAKNIIREYVSDLKLRLRNQEHILLDDIGIFRPSPSGNPVFESFSDINYLVDSFGLSPLEVSEKEKITSLESPKMQIGEIAARNSTLTFVIIGVIVISILLAITVFLSSKFDLYLFNIGSNKQDSEYIILGGKADKEVSKVNTQIEEYTSIKSALSYSTESKDTVSPPAKNYLLIVGSFKSYTNAKELNSKLMQDGFSSEIIESGGYYRVCVGRYEKKNTAQDELQRIRRQMNHSVYLLNATEN